MNGLKALSYICMILGGILMTLNIVFDFGALAIKISCGMIAVGGMIFFLLGGNNTEK